jgi:hypothetical protein
MPISKAIRELIHNKYAGKCAYCGCELQKGWHVDHIEPVFRNWTVEALMSYELKRGADCIENYNPSCPRCNTWKSTLTVEQFRTELQKQTERMRRDSSAYRISLDFGLVSETQVQVVFYFEKHNTSHNGKAEKTKTNAPRNARGRNSSTDNGPR